MNNKLFLPKMSIGGYLKWLVSKTRDDREELEIEESEGEEW